MYGRWWPPEQSDSTMHWHLHYPAGSSYRGAGPALFLASGQNAQVVHIDVRTETVDGIAEHVPGTRGREGFLALGGLGPQVIWAAGDVVVDVGVDVVLGSPLQP